MFTLKYEYVYNLYRNNCRRLPGGVYLDYEVFRLGFLHLHVREEV